MWSEGGVRVFGIGWSQILGTFAAAAVSAYLFLLVSFADEGPVFRTAACARAALAVIAVTAAAGAPPTGGARLRQVQRGAAPAARGRRPRPKLAADHARPRLPRGRPALAAVPAAAAPPGGPPRRSRRGRGRTVSGPAGG